MLLYSLHTIYNAEFSVGSEKKEKFTFIRSTKYSHKKLSGFNFKRTRNSKFSVFQLDHKQRS